MKIAFLLLLSWPLCAGDFRASQAMLAGSAISDVMSSRGRYELNPVLGAGAFTVQRQGAKVFALTGGMLLAETLLVRKWPSLQRAFKWINFGGAAAHGAAAAWNWSDR